MSREEARKEILQRLEEEMRNYPDMRFGQLVSNVLVNHLPIEHQHSELFYVTDEEAAQRFYTWKNRAICAHHSRCVYVAERGGRRGYCKECGKPVDYIPDEVNQ